MSFRLTAEQAAIRQAVREFGDAEIRPVAREHDESREYPEAIRKKAAEYDFVAPNIPEKYGGAGLDLLSVAVITEELWRADAGIGSAISSAGFGTAMLIKYGDEWMKETWLPKIAAGESVSASAISEPSHGSNVAGMETQAVRDTAEVPSASTSPTEAAKNGDEWVINGTKMWITNGTVADVALVMAKTDPDAGHRGITAFLVPTDSPGFTAHKIDNKLGIHASDLAELTFDNVRIPEENVVGEVNKGFYQLMNFFAHGRISVASQALGVAQAAVDEAISYAGEREQFDQPIAEFQAIRHKIADMATNVEAARSLTYRAATAVEAGDDELAAKFASMAKLFASEQSVRVADEGLQVHGGAGFVTDHPAERFYRDARITKIYEGTSEIQKNIIADRLL